MQRFFNVVAWACERAGLWSCSGDLRLDYGECLRVFPKFRGNS